MPFVLLFVALAVLAVVAVVAAGRGGSMTEAAPDTAPTDLPTDRPLVATDLKAVRLPAAFRGYRMDHVDAVLDRLAAELALRDARITALERDRSDEQPAPVNDADPARAREPR